jgi:asparagine synthetase B (glutamine-hydrolysing)
MSLMPSLANILGYYDPDPDRLRRVQEAMSASGEFEHIAFPLDGWIVGWKCLPDSDPFGREITDCHLAFAEGRGRFAGSDDDRDKTGATFRRLADTVTRAPKDLGTFPGDFGFVHFRPRGEASLVRSCGGLAPLYFWQDEDRTGVTTFYTWFVRFLPQRFELDALPNAIWAMGHSIFPDNRTFLNGVSIVPRGHCVTLRRRKTISVTQYWDPRPNRLPRMTRDSQREHADRLRNILFDKLETELHPSGGNLLTLSGGVDSSCLAALATQKLGKRIGTFSVVPSREDLLAHEMRFIRPLIEQPNVERSWFLTIGNEPQLNLVDSAPAVAFYVPHPALCKLQEIHREWPVRVLFGGEWADEMCGSHFTMADWKQQVALGRLIGQWLCGRMPVGPLDPLRVIKHRLKAAAGRYASPFVPMPDLFADQVRAEYQDWIDRRLKVMQSDPRPWKFLSEHLRQSDGYIAMNWEATTALGIRRSLPFVNREMFELTYSCRGEELLGPKTKKLLRRALRDNVPRDNLYRSDKGGWGAGVQRPNVVWNSCLPSVLRPLVRGDWWSQVQHSVDFADANRLVQLERAASLLIVPRIEFTLAETIG